MKSKVTKLISILLVVIMLVSISSSVFAETKSMEEVVEGMQKSAAGADTDQIITKGGGIMGILQTVGMVLSVIVLIVIGIKYILGSAEEKAEYKKTFIPYIVGAVLVFAASALAGVVVQFAQGLGTTGQ